MIRLFYAVLKLVFPWRWSIHWRRVCQAKPKFISLVSVPKCGWFLVNLYRLYLLFLPLSVGSTWDSVRSVKPVKACKCQTEKIIKIPISQMRFRLIHVIWWNNVFILTTSEGDFSVEACHPVLPKMSHPGGQGHPGHQEAIRGGWKNRWMIHSDSRSWCTHFTPCMVAHCATVIAL